MEATIVKDNSYEMALLQDKILAILKHFIAVCNKYNLRYCACGGTCIGALRHHGFIPWDDDLDVFMPRPDYERLWNIYNEQEDTSRFKLCRTDESRNYHHRVIRMVDLDTTFIVRKCADEDIEHGIYIDIIPLDACPDSPIQRLSQIIEAVIFSIYNIQCQPELHGGVAMRTMVRAMLSLIKDEKRRTTIWKYFERKMIKNEWGEGRKIVELTTNFTALLNPYPAEWFTFDGRKERFEDIDICVPTKAEEYLTKGFGDYMKLPPEEQRCARHDTVFIDLNNSYQIYRGKYYCCKKGPECD